MLITRYIASSVSELKSAIEKFSEGKFEYKQKIKSRDEFGILSLAFSEMAKRLKQLEGMFSKPFIGIANSGTALNPGHRHLRSIAESVKEGIRSAGEVPCLDIPLIYVPGGCNTLAIRYSKEYNGRYTVF